jgi:TRAP-type C4-dicarboxylate transport system substrate-binding protein
MNGGATVNQIPPQAYMNLDKGVVDAAFVNWAQILNYKLWEVAGVVYELGFSHGLLPTVVNSEVYNSMSPEDQQLMHDIWNNEAGAIVRKAMVEQDEMGKAEAIKFGTKVIQPTAEEKAVWVEDAEPIFAQWVKDADELGAKNADKVLAEWKRLTK